MAAAAWSAGRLCMRLRSAGSSAGLTSAAGEEGGRGGGAAGADKDVKFDFFILRAGGWIPMPPNPLQSQEKIQIQGHETLV